MFYDIYGTESNERQIPQERESVWHQFLKDGEKMGLYKYICMFMAVAVTITGCAAPDRGSQQNEEETVRKISLTVSRILEDTFQTVSQVWEDSYTVELETYHYENIWVEYPVVRNLRDKEREERINRLIEDFIFEDIVGTDNSYYQLDEVYMDMECRVTLQSPALLSFYCVGSPYLENSKPYDDVYTMTIDMKEVKELKLWDFVEIDEELVERIKNSSDVTNLGLEEYPDNEILRESLLYQTQHLDAEYFIRTRTEGRYGFVLEPDALVIEESVYYAAGCFVLVRLPGRIVDNRFVFEESPETEVSEQ